ncbi:MAG TPA: 4Fe-4S dicluster domain-containing protein [Candidatus Woesearchaeota archaeon]|nr:4Fe-4S dicluster domain-containing protein [Candidatus Woesearchaeota archaeon]
MVVKNKDAGNCNLCGVCNLTCPVYKVLQKESAGPRFKAFLTKKQEYKEVFFLCTQCTACVQSCPARINIEHLSIRAEMTKKGFETPANKIMRENIKHYGNPFGEIKKGRKIKQYYT